MTQAEVEALAAQAARLDRAARDAGLPGRGGAARRAALAGVPAADRVLRDAVRRRASASSWPATRRCGRVPRSGRHSLANYSTCSGMIIDVSLHERHLRRPGGELTARVGAGANFGLLNAVLDGYGLHVPGGTCADVGVAGFMQGGGYGLTSRRFGINRDCVARGHDDARRRHDRRRRRDARARPVVGGARRDRQPVRRSCSTSRSSSPSCRRSGRSSCAGRSRTRPAALDAIQRGLHARRRQRRRRLPRRDGDDRRCAVPADARALLRRPGRRAARAAAAAGRRAAAVQRRQSGTYNAPQRRAARRAARARACRRRWRPSAAGTSRRRSAWTAGQKLVQLLRDDAEPVQHHGPRALRRGAARPTRARTRRSSTARSTATSSSTRSGTRRGPTATRRPR